VINQITTLTNKKVNSTPFESDPFTYSTQNITHSKCTARWRMLHSSHEFSTFTHFYGILVNA